jgi:putative heme-binding domain-containing protein
MRTPAAMLALLMQLPATAQHGSTTAVNPYTGSEHAEAGARLFRTQCAGCHGPEGTGTATGPNLTTGTYQRGGSDEALFQTISKGIPGTTMPAFPQSGLRIWQLVTYLRSLTITKAAKPAGNAERGAALFAANCAVCHSGTGQGGVIGPDLTTVAVRRSPADLRRSVMEPDADVPHEYWSISMRTTSGNQLRGIRLNEDTHSVQLRDANGRLISILKRDVAESELIRRSPMPSFAGRLSSADIDDVVAHLTTLRGSRGSK